MRTNRTEMKIIRYDVQKLAASIHDRYEMLLTFRRMLDEMGLGDWVIKMDKAVCRLGACWHDRHWITFSKNYVDCTLERNTPIDLVRTFLHEVAHAFAGVNARHGKTWRQYCAELGLDVISARHKWSSCEESPRAMVGKWQIVHCETGEVFHYYVKKPRRTNFSNLYIVGRKAETIGKLVLKKIER